MTSKAHPVFGMPPARVPENHVERTDHVTSGISDNLPFWYTAVHLQPEFAVHYSSALSVFSLLMRTFWSGANVSWHLLAHPLPSHVAPLRFSTSFASSAAAWPDFKSHSAPLAFRKYPAPLAASLLPRGATLLSQKASITSLTLPCLLLAPAIHRRRSLLQTHCLTLPSQEGAPSTHPPFPHCLTTLFGHLSLASGS